MNGKRVVLNVKEVEICTLIIYASVLVKKYPMNAKQMEHSNQP